MARFFYFVPGILTRLENPRTWDYQAQLWVHDKGYGVGAGFNYSDGVIGATLALSKQARTVAMDLYSAREAGMEPVIAVAHSNGCRMVLDALSKYLIHADELHLLAPAADCDCRKNGLNEIAERGQVKRVVLYASPADEVLGGSGAVGFGELGKLGPTNLSPKLAGMLSEVHRICRHGDWVGKDFEETMNSVVSGQKPVASDCQEMP